MPTGKGRSFSTKTNDRLRDMARELRKKHPSDHAFARELGVAQPTITNFLNGGTAGVQLASKIAEASGIQISFERNEVRFGEGDRVNWSGLPWWDTVIERARALFPQVSAEAWAWLGSLAGAAPPGADPWALGTIAATWDQATARARVEVDVSDASKTRVRRKAGK